MPRRVVVKSGTYRDSITLLRISKAVEAVTGVTKAAVVMATPLNKRVLAEVGFSGKEVLGAKTDDLVVAVEAANTRALESALAVVDRQLSSGNEMARGRTLPRSIVEAKSQSPDLNLAVISVPGAYAKKEASRAIEAGLNVFLFSSNVSRSDELELKRRASAKNLLFMGPDCGSAIINGAALGFGNAVRKGSVGIVSASGTGLQEVATLVHKYGLGISQAIGTGGGDVSDDVGGLTTLQGLELLEDDPQTKIIVVISKPPGPRSEAKIVSRISKIHKPVVVNFLGSKPRGNPRYTTAETLDDAANAAWELANGSHGTLDGPSDLTKSALAESSRLGSGQKYLRGLFAGGTICYEAQVVLSPTLGRIYSNSPLDRSAAVEGTAKSRDHTCIDMGGEEFVVGRAHPMIDFTLRKLRILEEAKDPETAVLLLDVELGIGSNPDPAGELIPAIVEARALAKRDGRYLPVVASIIGTEEDSQGLHRQEESLSAAGVVIRESSAEAARLAGMIASRNKAGPSRAERSH